jgi:hypothetical protein
MKPVVRLRRHPLIYPIFLAAIYRLPISSSFAGGNLHLVTLGINALSRLSRYFSTI